jgi:hypothetical protein
MLEQRQLLNLPKKLWWEFNLLQDMPKEDLYTPLGLVNQQTKK